MAQKGGDHLEQARAPCPHSVEIDVGGQQGGVAILDRGDLRPPHPQRQDKVRDGAQPRFGGGGLFVERLERLAPPGEADRPDCRFGRVRDDLRERRVEAKNRLDRVADLNGKVCQRQRPVGRQRTLSDR
ncbi:hypothetical protein WJT74_04520 [Sphingomicrobium sp. XHP0239]